MKLKIISDGTVFGTKVVNSETGETLENVAAINVRRIDAEAEDMIVRADLTLCWVEMEIEAEGTATGYAMEVGS